jgi:hypothetical protein
MLYWTIQVIFFSILFILLIHHIIHFLKSTLTTTKVKDIVNSRNQKYEEIYNIVSNNDNNSSDINSIYINSNNNNNNNNTNSNEIFSYSLEDLLPKKEDKSTVMKNELKNFLKTQMDTNETS